ncbi:MAG: 4-oxalocrotonate tautomerase [Polyangiales bacterium]|jgi:4-oxalocrotonate tautomerase
MPFIHIRVTDEGVSDTQKAELIQGVTEVMVRVLGKSPNTTFVVIDEVPLSNWGVGGLPVERFRRRNIES